jgi:hypothetical protein
VVPEHGPENVDPPSGQGEHSLSVALALGSLAVIEGPGGGTALDADHGRGVENALQLSVVSRRPVQVAGPVAGVVWGGGEAGVAGEVVG